MSIKAWLYIWSIFSVGALSTVYACLNWEPTTSPWALFAVLTTLATIAQLLRVEAPNHQLYFATFAFIFAGLILLPPFLFVAMIVITYMIQWAKERLTHSPHLRHWYLQPFNICNHILTGLIARLCYTFLFNWLGRPVDSGWSVLVSLFTAAIYVWVNHLVVGIVLILARRVSFRESGILNLENLLSDFVLACLGIVIAIIWGINGWFILPALSPLVLMYQALKIPQLKKEAQTDEKTGLLNARHFASLFEAELNRAKRFNRPLCVIMADLDLLRNVNNTYGHLAGDMVLAGIGKVIRRIVREYDIAGRFGGEEFVVALPETDVTQAYEIAERIRQTIENTGFQVQTSAVPIQVTMSLGIASFPQDAAAANDLIHQADLSVYQAKLRGRNCVVLASDVPHSAKLETISAVNRLDAPTYSFVTRVPIGVATPPAPIVTVTPKLASTFTSRPKPGLGFVFVGLIILLGGLVALYGLQQPVSDWFMIAVLAGLGAIAEAFQVRLYGDSTISVSATIGFAAALLTGIPGIVFVSAAIVAMHYLRNCRIPIYKTVFNWATHLLAASLPAILFNLLGLSLTMDALLPLIAFTTPMAFVYYGVESGLITLAIGLFDGKRMASTWWLEFRWMIVYYLAFCHMGLLMAIVYHDPDIALSGVLIFLLPMAVLYYAQKQYVERTKDGVNELQRMNQELTTANRQIVKAHESIRQMNDELFQTFAKILDARDPFVSGHAAQVAEYAQAIARELGLASERVDWVRQSALLHDIGKIGISERVLHKPTKLNAEEYEFVKKHSLLGADFLETSQGLRHLAPFIRHHHEWWNGNGYPAKLVGEQIPLEARILAVCDAVEAMASDRAYHRAMTPEEIIAELRRCAGVQFDPAIVQAFIRVAERYGASLIVNSARGVVEKQNGHSHPAEAHENKGAPVRWDTQLGFSAP